jgi:hypothetical protein
MEGLAATRRKSIASGVSCWIEPNSKSKPQRGESSIPRLVNRLLIVSQTIQRNPSGFSRLPMLQLIDDAEHVVAPLLEQAEHRDH